MIEHTYIHAFIEAWNSGEPARILAFYGQEYEGQEISDPKGQHGRQGVEQMIRKFFDAFPDLAIQPIDWVCEGDKVSLYWEATGTHNGRILNIPPTRKKVAIQGASLIQVKDGLIISGRHLWDLAAMLRHIGLLPALS
ncbi:MAG: ester cyclase [Phaeodactylibacter sp.]|nr:ester cyclase [Phaeodactylibacter sp.]MCB9274978.1 ester cyclase [Lewinellaceae bacterium]